jgi:intraflagellar transport protein 46
MLHLQDLFKYIGKYRPPAVELPTRLKPFIPEFIPAIGGTDEFIKVPRPDGRPDYLGLKVGSSGLQAELLAAVLTAELLGCQTWIRFTQHTAGSSMSRLCLCMAQTSTYL